MKTKLQHLSVKGKAPKKLRKLVGDCTTFYAHMLFSSQLQPHISVVVKLVKKIRPGIEGECSIIGYGRKKAPRHFIIHCKRDVPVPEMLTTLAHEMVHCKQFALGELDEQLSAWKGSKVSESLDYWDHPWEIEAYGKQIGLYARAVKKCKVKKYLREHNQPCTKK